MIEMYRSRLSGFSGKVEKHLKAPLVSIIILNYNGGKTFLKCLDSIKNMDYPVYEVIVVDNGSSDGSLEKAKRGFHAVTYIENGRNLGFCTGNNIGIRHSQGEYVILLNDDAILRPNSISELIREAIRNGDGFYNPKILLLRNPKLLDSAGNNLHLSGLGLVRGLGEIDRGQYSRLEEVAYANGTCVLVPRRVTEKIGLLDPAFFAYGEDVDWCWRGKMFGFNSYYVPSAIVYHELGASWGRVAKIKLYFVERNRLITLLKNYSGRSLRLLLPVLLLTEVSTLFYALKGGWLSQKIKAYTDVFKLRNYIRRERRSLQSQRTVTDTEVTRLFCKEMEHPYIKGPMTKVLNSIFKFLSKTIHL